MSVDGEAEIARLLAARELEAASTLALRCYGPSVLGFLAAVMRDHDETNEAFSQFAEDMWRGIAGFKGECTFKAWAYKLAWHAALRLRRDAYRRRRQPLAGNSDAFVAQVRSTTASHQRTDVKERVAALRASLALDEQTLLVLRVDRGLSWREIAAVLDDDQSEATLRKRYERLKDKLRRLARAGAAASRR
jgi:RNA polymerase sigma-70 factor (ECF subfamily)